VAFTSEQSTQDDARIDDSIMARQSFDALDAILTRQERRLRAEWRAVQDAKRCAQHARHAAARVAGAPHIAGSDLLPAA
jgi:hypothetical protein